MRMIVYKLDHEYGRMMNLRCMGNVIPLDGTCVLAIVSVPSIVKQQNAKYISYK